MPVMRSVEGSAPGRRLVLGSVEPAALCQLYSGAVEPGARWQDQVQPAPAPAPLGKAKPSELLRLRRKSWPSAQLQERSHQCTQVSGAMQCFSKVRERGKSTSSSYLEIGGWSKKWKVPREKGLSCYTAVCLAI